MRNGRQLLIGFILIFSLGSAAQSAYEPPRTSSGHPDLQGIFTWRTLTPLERPDTVGNRSGSRREVAETE